MPSPHNSWLPRYSGLLTDLYELTMAAGYVQNRFVARATFELFVRHLPPHRNYMVAAGLEQALDFLENVRFSEEEISYLRALPLFGHVQSEFFDYLRKFRFTGDVWALPEGTIFFPGDCSILPYPEALSKGSTWMRGDGTGCWMNTMRSMAGIRKRAGLAGTHWKNWV